MIDLCLAFTLFCSPTTLVQVPYDFKKTTEEILIDLVELNKKSDERIKMMEALYGRV